MIFWNMNIQPNFVESSRGHHNHDDIVTIAALVNLIIRNIDNFFRGN